jgi:hypothetical protein
MQEWEWCYLLTKACRLSDATATLGHWQAAASGAGLGSSQAPAYVASRGEGGAPLPEVGVRAAGQEGFGGRRKDDDEWLLERKREVVVRHAVEGLRGALVRELMETMDV